MSQKKRFSLDSLKVGPFSDEFEESPHFNPIILSGITLVSGLLGMSDYHHGNFDSLITTLIGSGLFIGTVLKEDSTNPLNAKLENKINYEDTRKSQIKKGWGLLKENVKKFSRRAYVGVGLSVAGYTIGYLFDDYAEKVREFL